MYAFWFFIATVCLYTEVSSKSCLEVKLEHEKRCQKSDVENYVTCVKARMKRHSYDCKYDEGCYDCDCESCQYSECGGQCSDCCNSCCTNYVQCHTTHCCHKQCHSECRSYDCRSSCRKSCYESIPRETTEKEINREYKERIVDRTVLVNGGASGLNSNVQSNTSNVNAHNITTVINLKNIINNTNVIDVPINLNYTNKNNISLTGAGGQYGGPGGPSSGDTSADDCCVVIGPRQCRQEQIYPYIRCFNFRSRQCGSICSTTVTQKELMNPLCTVNALGKTVCHQSAYVPQPQPRCSYSSTWPYVRCEMQPPHSCKGCYGQYLNSQAKEYKSCPSQCYGDLNTGSLYRQGNFYQPTYSQLPPCYFSPQGCGALGGSGNTRALGANGGFGTMSAYGNGLGGYIGGLDTGFGGGFGYAAQLPITQPGLPVLQPQPFNPQLLYNSPYSTANNDQMLLNTSDTYEPQRQTRHLVNNQNLRTVQNRRKDHIPFTSRTALPSAHREALDRMTIDKYQMDGDGRLMPLYELPDREVKIDVQVIDQNKTKQFQLSTMRKIQKKQHKIKEVAEIET